MMNSTKMNSTKAYFSSLAKAIGVVLLIAVLVKVAWDMGLGSFFWSSFSPCSDTIIAKAKSPDGQRMAVAFEHDCGATTRGTTIVAVHNGARTTTSTTFYPNMDKDVVLIMDGVSEVRLQWRSNTKLIVSTHIAGRAIKLEHVWKDVQILYNSP